MKIARVAEPRDKITGADFKAMKGFEDGGPVYRDPPMEPVTGEEETSAFMDEMLFEDRRLKDKKSREEYKKTSRRGDDEPVKTYRDGGMVRGCKGFQVKGKKFSGTF